MDDVGPGSGSWVETATSHVLDILCTDHGWQSPDDGVRRRVGAELIRLRDQYARDHRMSAADTETRVSADGLAAVAALCAWTHPHR